MRLRPSEIRFSQDSISNTFDGGYTAIGSLVNDVIEGRTKIDDIPTIEVAELNGKWTTLDNRRLWVFQTLESRGRCRDIEVRVVISQVHAVKQTSTNSGVSIKVRGDPYRAPGRSTKRRDSDLFDFDSDMDMYNSDGDMYCSYSDNDF